MCNPGTRICGRTADGINSDFICDYHGYSNRVNKPLCHQRGVPFNKRDTSLTSGEIWMTNGNPNREIVSVFLQVRRSSEVVRYKLRVDTLTTFMEDSGAEMVLSSPLNKLNDLLPSNNEYLTAFVFEMRWARNKNKVSCWRRTEIFSVLKKNNAVSQCHICCGEKLFFLKLSYNFLTVFCLEGP